jgi:hypothetical protein
MGANAAFGLTLSRPASLFKIEGCHRRDQPDQRDLRNEEPIYGQLFTRADEDLAIGDRGSRKFQADARLIPLDDVAGVIIGLAHIYYSGPPL